MNSSEEKPDSLRKWEWSLAILMVSLLALYHGVVLFHAGGLWRDEANTAMMATLPTLSDIWKNLQFDSFPMLWFLVVRAWSALGLTSEMGFRLLGGLVGITLIALLWINARRLKYGFPFFALLFLALNPSIIRYGDSIRAYGFGICLFLVTFGCIWKVTTSPTRSNVIAALLAAVLSVHALYYNAVLLLAICLGGMAVAIRHSHWKRVGLLLGIGMITALSILPYASTIKDASSWNFLVQIPHYNFSFFWNKLGEAINTPGEKMLRIWLVFLLAALLVGILVQFSPEKFHATARQKDLALFSTVALLVGAPAYFVFLKILSYLTQPWYYVALMALVAVNVDAILSILGNIKSWRIFRLVLILLVMGLTFTASWRTVHIRHTNADLVAARLEREAAAEDLIVVNWWYYGVSFDFHYRGKTPWTTLPPIPFHKFHRYDLFKEKMTMPDQIEAIQPVLDQISETLRAGHRVWLVGDFTPLPVGQRPELLPPAPKSPYGWLDYPYMFMWMEEAGYFIQEHATSGKPIEDFFNGPVDPKETLEMTVLKGWKK